LEAATRRLAERLRDSPAISLGAAKQAVYMSQAAELEEMLRYETEAQMRCFESEKMPVKVCRGVFRERERRSLPEGEWVLELSAMQVLLNFRRHRQAADFKVGQPTTRCPREFGGLEAYRSAPDYTQYDRLLGFDTTMEVDAFLSKAGSSLIMARQG
jgi:hypothetical protein